MSLQFGTWNLNGKPVDRAYLEKVKPLLAPYGPDGLSLHLTGNVGFIYCSLQTTEESRRETQPHVMTSGAVLMWDGRLDNRAELIRELSETVNPNSTDVEIVAASYERWGMKCFARLLGDWAFSVWEPRTRSLLLAKDPIGVRLLFYSLEHHRITWTTILDPLVLVPERTTTLCEEYLAGWFGSFPAVHLTPYIGIHSVPPSCSVVLHAGRHFVTKYWDFDAEKKICYRTDAEYEEQYRYVFAEAVRRRLRSNRPVLAELSGGMDSSSIVCVADRILSHGLAETPRLDTVSYYNDSEPNWNERPFFESIEKQRGRSGCHIDISSQRSFSTEFEADRFAATPACDLRRSAAAERFASLISEQQNRIVLTGIGGDEVTGGEPTAVPELADLIAQGQLKTLSHRLKVWALHKRKPWFHLFFEAAVGFLPTPLALLSRQSKVLPWLEAGFMSRNRAALAGYPRRLKLTPPPSFQENIFKLDTLRRQLACSVLSEVSHDRCYPYLDREFLEFLFAIPREQLVRPGQRRSLLRRALSGIVPDSILNRRSKAYVARAPIAAICNEWPSLIEMSQHLTSASLGIVAPKAFSAALQRARNGQQVAIVLLMRTLSIELWLRSLQVRSLLDVHMIPSPLVRATNGETRAMDSSLSAA